MSDMKRLKAALRELAVHFTPENRYRSAIPSTYAGAAYDVISAAEQAGLLKVEDPLQIAIKALQDIKSLKQDVKSQSFPVFLRDQFISTQANLMAEVALLKIEDNMP